MNRKGFVDGPFQLLINVIVLGMALALGYYLYDNAQCFQCNTNFDAEILELRENIASVGKGDINTKRHDNIRIQGLGSCAKAIYIKQFTSADGSKCENFCPSHPRDCWVIFATRRCGDNQDPDPECIDIAGDTSIISNIIPTVTDPQGNLYRNAKYIASDMPVSIEKTGPNEITIGKY